MPSDDILHNHGVDELIDKADEVHLFIYNMIFENNQTKNSLGIDCVFYNVTMFSTETHR